MADGSDPYSAGGYAGYGNTNKLLAAAGNTPDTMNGWLTAARQGQALQQGQVQLQQQDFDLASGRLKAMQNLLGSIGQNPTQDNLVGRVTDAQQAGVLPADMASRILTTTAGMTPQQLQQTAYDHLQQLGTYQEKLNAAYGQPGTMSLGDKVIPVTTRTGPNAGVYPAGGGSFTVGQNPDFAGTVNPYTDSASNTTYLANSQAQAKAGYSPPTGGYQPAGAARNGAIPQASSAGPVQPGDVIRKPLRGSPTIAGAGVAANASQPAMGGPNVGFAGPTAGVADAAKVAGTASAEQGVALQRTADGAPIRKAMLANLSDDLDKFTSGPGADWQSVGKAWANRNVLPQSMQFDPQSIASQEAFNKQATQLAQQQFTSLGGTGTDNQLSAAFKANPNQALSKLGNQQIIALLKGNEDAITAKANAWQAWQQQNGPASYGAFQTDFNKTYNPRVYSAMYMSPDQIADMRKNMSPAQQQQFASDYVALKNKGYITPGAGNGQQ